MRSDPAAAEWWAILEYDIPRRGKVIDLTLLNDAIIFVVELKVGQGHFHAQDSRQAEDYAYELADFHAESDGRVIVPVLLPTSAASAPELPAFDGSGVQRVVRTTRSSFARSILRVHQQLAIDAPRKLNASGWLESPYRPTPTIVEAAQRLYAAHSVEAITRSDATISNLSTTQAAVLRAIDRAKQHRRKSICFITGVPGAGKTLAGLNATVGIKDRSCYGPPAYLSGNGPLVKVLSEALARDQSNRGHPIGAARRETGSFIQNVHRFIDNYLTRDTEAPVNKVVVFDEAQRAWNLRRCEQKYMRRESEPMSMLKIMDRHTDWAVLICLIGGGQEIHTGEAGLREWGRALEEHFPHWRAFVSPELQEGVDGPVGQTLLAGESRLDVTADADLHLGVSIRCFRTTALSRWVEHVLDNRPEDAMAAMTALQSYPIVMTRSLAEARAWLQSRARGLRRSGLVASSGAKRLRRFGVDVDGKNEPVHWFLADCEDVRSSTYLEVPATEFDIQGLEVDWAGLCWDADLRRADGGWRCMRFRGTRWENIRGEADRQYLLNKYRVLLTRAREGVVIWVPPGDAGDAYSLPEWYDEIAGYLAKCGVTNLSAEPARERSANA